MDNWIKQFEKEVIDYFWGRENTIGTQRLSINHINKIKEFISSLLQQKDQEWKDKIEKWANDVMEDKDISNGRYNAMNDLIKFIKQ